MKEMLSSYDIMNPCGYRATLRKDIESSEYLIDLFFKNSMIQRKTLA